MLFVLMNHRHKHLDPKTNIIRAISVHAYKKILQFLTETVVTRCADPELQAFVADSRNSAGKWICQQQ
jgi:hypothetical protein